MRQFSGDTNVSQWWDLKILARPISGVERYFVS